MSGRPEFDPDKVTAGLKRMLNARLAWDEDMAIGFLYCDPSSAAGRITATEIPLPKRWVKTDPKYAPRALTQLLTKPESRQQTKFGDELLAQVPPDLVGVWQRTEGWEAPQSAARLVLSMRDAGLDTGPIKRMPGRIEVRVASAVDVHGRIYMANQSRDTMKLEGGWTAPDGAFGTDREGARLMELRGGVPAALSGLLTALTTPRT